MALLSPNQGDVKLLGYMLNKVAQGDVKLRLYKNDITPAKTDVLATYTESTATGYSAATLTGANWTIGTVGNVTTAVYAQQTFTYTAAEAIYGYYVTDTANTTVLWAEEFAAVENIPSAGGSIAIVPTITLN